MAIGPERRVQLVPVPGGSASARAVPSLGVDLVRVAPRAAPQGLLIRKEKGDESGCHEEPRPATAQVQEGDVLPAERTSEGVQEREAETANERERDRQRVGQDHGADGQCTGRGGRMDCTRRRKGRGAR